MQVKPAAWFLVVALVLFISAARLPAPISEIPQTTPTPKPKREATPRQKSKPESTAKLQKSPTLSFAGNWAGTVTCFDKKGNCDGTSPLNYIIRISDDEKTVWLNSNFVGQNISGVGRQAPCNRFREALTWSLVNPGRTHTDTLQLNANGTASFVLEGRWTSGDKAGTTFTHTGVLSRQ